MGNSVFVNIFKKVDYLCNVEDFYILVEFLDVGFDEIDELASLAKL